MVGSFGGDQTLVQGGSDMDATLLRLANPDLFTKRCLYPLQLTTPYQVAEKIQSNKNSLFTTAFQDRLVSLFDILKMHGFTSEYFQFVPPQFILQGHSENNDNTTAVEEDA